MARPISGGNYDCNGKLCREKVFLKKQVLEFNKKNKPSKKKMLPINKFFSEKFLAKIKRHLFFRISHHRKQVAFLSTQ